MRQWLIDEHAPPARVDRFLADELKLGRAQARGLVERGNVRVNGHRVRKSYLVGPGDEVVLLEEPLPSVWPPAPSEGAPLEVVLERESFLVVSKPPGQPCVPLTPDETGTLANAIVGHYPELSGIGYKAQEAGLLHRLDNGTSGLLLVARTATAFKALRAMLSAGHLQKHYLALTHGEPPLGKQQGSIGKDGTHRSRAVVTEWPTDKTLRPVHMEVLKVEAKPFSTALVEVVARKAARHQIRAQLSALGHPLVGDTLYGAGPRDADLPTTLPEHFLHASRIAFEAPGTGEAIDVTQPLAATQEQFLSSLAAEPAGGPKSDVP